MQIYFRSFTHCFLGEAYHRKVRGFTLVELLISAAIITIITSIVLVRYTAFDSTVFRKNLAYEIATSIREAQVYSLSVIRSQIGGDTSFRHTFGMSFPGDNTTYRFFEYSGTDEHPNFDDLDSSIVTTFNIGSPMKILEVCVDVGVPHCNITHLDISFRRPEFSALFYADGYIGNQDDIQSGMVKIGSDNGGEVWVVEVSKLGQISVKKGS